MTYLVVLLEIVSVATKGNVSPASRLKSALTVALYFSSSWRLLANFIGFAELPVIPFNQSKGVPEMLNNRKWSGSK